MFPACVIENDKIDHKMCLHIIGCKCQSTASCSEIAGLHKAPKVARFQCCGDRDKIASLARRSISCDDAI